MRPVDVQNMVFRSMDVERMAQVLLQAEVVQQQQLARTTNAEIARRLYEVPETNPRPGMGEPRDAEALSDRERAGRRTPMRRRRPVRSSSAGEEAPSGGPTGLPQAPDSGSHIDVYR